MPAVTENECDIRRDRIYGHIRGNWIWAVGIFLVTLVPTLGWCVTKMYTNENRIAVLEANINMQNRLLEEIKSDVKAIKENGSRAVQK